MNLKDFILRRPIISYFIMAFSISWLGAFILVAPKLLSGQVIGKIDGILMFPVMLLGPASAGIILTALSEGKAGLRNLRLRMSKWKLPFKWYLVAVLVPPCLILAVLLLLKHFVSPVFTPNFFALGFLFGIPAGFFEEIGWTGYVFPKMRLQQGTIKAGVVLGLLWGLWHFPVIDFLGAASPHRQYLLPFFLAFIAILTAMRIFIVWIYTNTHSILLAQFMHAISTGCLATFGPPALSPARETLWYALYAAILWIAVLIFFTLKRQKIVEYPLPSLLDGRSSS